MRRMQLGLVLVTMTLLTAAPAAAAPLQFSAVLKPQISGDVNAPRVGETLTEISAVWTRAPKSVEYHWLACAPGQSIEQCTAIPGARTRSRRPTSGSMWSWRRPGTTPPGRPPSR